MVRAQAVTASLTRSGSLACQMVQHGISAASSALFEIQNLQPMNTRYRARINQDLFVLEWSVQTRTTCSPGQSAKSFDSASAQPQVHAATA